MIIYGCLARFFNRYSDEVKFAKKNDFHFMQLWYDKNGLSLYENDSIETILKFNYPTIIHAVLDINEFEEHIAKLINILKILNHNELIIHPICKSEKVRSESNLKLNKKVKFALKHLQQNKIQFICARNRIKNYAGKLDAIKHLQV